MDIRPDHPDYGLYVKVRDKKNYEIFAERIAPGERIVCPNDPDMTISKDADGSVIIGKRTLLTRPFSRA